MCRRDKYFRLFTPTPEVLRQVVKKSEMTFSVQKYTKAADPSFLVTANRGTEWNCTKSYRFIGRSTTHANTDTNPTYDSRPQANPTYDSQTVSLTSYSHNV
ncbi:hypothetical protein J6590_097141 [Homalodisca vitripennis]|nr:hypothetical protein J6590_097141 [Homalodisca vitripennis]